MEGGDRQRGGGDKELEGKGEGKLINNNNH